MNDIPLRFTERILISVELNYTFLIIIHLFNKMTKVMQTVISTLRTDSYSCTIRSRRVKFLEQFHDYSDSAVKRGEKNGSQFLIMIINYV